MCSSFNIFSIFCFLKRPNQKLGTLYFLSYRHSAGIAQKRLEERIRKTGSGL